MINTINDQIFELIQPCLDAVTEYKRVPENKEVKWTKCDLINIEGILHLHIGGKVENNEGKSAELNGSIPLDIVMTFDKTIVKQFCYQRLLQNEKLYKGEIH